MYTIQYTISIIDMTSQHYLTSVWRKQLVFILIFIPAIRLFFCELPLTTSFNIKDAGLCPMHEPGACSVTYLLPCTGCTVTKVPPALVQPMLIGIADVEQRITVGNARERERRHLIKSSCLCCWCPSQHVHLLWPYQVTDYIDGTGCPLSER